MIKLYQFRTAWGVPNPSPFCTKTETMLRMMDLPFEIVTLDDPRKAPKGKLPFIEDGAARVGDSSFIQDYLEKKKGTPLDAALSPAQKGVSQAARRMLEEGTYFAMMYSRWIDDAGWRVVAPAYFGHMPPVFRTVFPNMLRKGIGKMLKGQGTLRHSRQEIYDMANRDLTALSAMLGSQKYFFGDTPSSLDAVAFAFLVNIDRVPIDSPTLRHYQSLPNLKAHTDRMHERFYKK